MARFHYCRVITEWEFDTAFDALSTDGGNTISTEDTRRCLCMLDFDSLKVTVGSLDQVLQIAEDDSQPANLEIFYGLFLKMNN
jgi:hypothetical protein